MKLGRIHEGSVLAHCVQPVDSSRGLAQALPLLKAAWLGLLDEGGGALDRCRGGSPGFPSIVDTDSGRVLAE